MATQIPATAPVTVPAEAAVTYDSWYMVMCLINATPSAAPATIRLQRCYYGADGAPVLMPGSPRDTQVTINLDLFQQMTAFPAIAAAEEAVLQAIVAYGQAKGLL